MRTVPLLMFPATPPIMQISIPHLALQNFLYFNRDAFSYTQTFLSSSHTYPEIKS